MLGLPVSFFGMVAAITSVITVVVGLPKQIRKNYKNKSCEGLDKTLFILVLFAYSTWTVFGGVKGDLFLLIANIPGVIFESIICWQMWIYRQKKLPVLATAITEGEEA